MIPTYRDGDLSMIGGNGTIDYEISFADGRVQNFHIELDPETLSLVHAPRESYPEWTKLSCFQCENCSLDPQKHTRCPVAENLLEATDAFARNISHEEVSVVIRTPPRNYQRKISLQSALRSLFGIYMAASGCPVLDKLRPMVITHLPFATITETAYRAFSMYALAQCFIHKKGGTPDLEFKKLGEIYKNVETVNRALHHRLMSAGFEDATLNAITNLNCYAQFTEILLEPRGMERIEKLFSAYE